MIPTRVQRSRQGGTRLPQNTLCCTRPGKYSNPFRVEMHAASYWRIHITDPTEEQLYVLYRKARGYWSKDEAVADAVECFRQWLDMMKPEVLSACIAPLREYQHLACWCDLDAPCHVDVLIEKLSVSI